MDADKWLKRIQQNVQQQTANKNKEAQKKRDLSRFSVTKSNALARAFYSFTLSEKRVFEALVSQMHPQRTDNNEYLELSALDYSKTYNVDRSNSYKQLTSVVDGLMHKIIVAEREDVKETHKFNLTSSAIYKHDMGLIRVKFNPEMLPYIQGLRSKFTTYPLAQAANFRSVYTWRFYELLASWAKPKEQTQGAFAGWFKADLFELREQLGVPQSYVYGMFERSVLDVVTRELEEKAGIHLSIERIKTSRKITHLNISFVKAETITQTARK